MIALSLVVLHAENPRDCSHWQSENLQSVAELGIVHCMAAAGAASAARMENGAPADETPPPLSSSFPPGRAGVHAARCLTVCRWMLSAALGGVRNGDMWGRQVIAELVKHDLAYASPLPNQG